jgi:hypothetical protein
MIENSSGVFGRKSKIPRGGEKRTFGFNTSPPRAHLSPEKLMVVP